MILLKTEVVSVVFTKKLRFKPFVKNEKDIRASTGRDRHRFQV
jgi:hypothetical protein